MICKLDKDFLSPLLREHGFRKKGLTWNWAGTDIVHVLDVQQSRFSGPEEIDLTINIGIWIPAVWSICWGKEIPNFIKESECFPRFRIGTFLSDFRRDALDRWWSLRSEDDIDKVGQELQAILSERVFPFLSRFTSMSEVKVFCDATALQFFPADKLCYAILDYLTNDLVGYDRLIGEFADKKLAAWQPNVAEVAQRLQGWTGSVL